MLTVQGDGSQLYVDAPLVAQDGALRLAAGQRVGASGMQGFDISGDIEIEAADGLALGAFDDAGRWQDEEGAVFGRTHALGTIRIVGDQTIAAGQRLALRLIGEGEADRLEVSGSLDLRAPAGALTGAALDVILASSDPGGAAYAPRLGDVAGLVVDLSFTHRGLFRVELR